MPVRIGMSASGIGVAATAAAAEAVDWMRAPAILVWAALTPATRPMVSCASPGSVSTR
jgi:hypothetical protein